MPNLYARATALPNIVGRIEYISSHDRQERLLAAYDGAANLLDGQFWQLLAKESQAAFEQFGYESRAGREEKLKCCEGREIMIPLANSLRDRMSDEEIVKTVVDTFRDKLGLIVAAGLHLKHDGEGPDNLHVHVVFPERHLLAEPVIKIAERNLFFNAEGKRVYKKSEILDENKQLLPGCRIVKKGEIYEQRYFGSVEQKYSSKSWLKETKTNVILQLRNNELRGDIEITEYDPKTGMLPQQHIEKGMEQEKALSILRSNEMVRKFNRMVESGSITIVEALGYQARILSSKNRENVLRQTLWEIKKNQSRKQAVPGQRRIIAKRSREIQNSLDAIKVFMDVGAKNRDDLELKLKELGRALGEAKKKYENAAEFGNLDERIAATEELREAKENYKKVARAIDNIRKSEHQPYMPEGPIDPDDR